MNGKVAGAAFDVFETEPPDFKSPLFNHSKIICTPHLGASTEEAQEKVAVQIAEQVSAYFKRSEYSGAVNLPFQKIDPKLERFLELAENIGYLHSQVLKSAPKGIKVLISGDFLHFNASLVTTAAIKGFLKDRRSENVNLVNAGILLKESGISSSEIKAPDDDNFNNIIEVVIESEDGVKRISGTVFGNREQRILKIDEYLVEFSPDGDYLLYYNVDKPGVLASVSSYLAGAGYNISGVSLGRNGGGKIALSIIGIDGEIRPEIIKVISGTDGIIAVYAVKFRGAR
jgi:D-3-phosphoglycerate dehydrogenase / 2-oxoglutarate reductase